MCIESEKNIDEDQLRIYIDAKKRDKENCYIKSFFIRRNPLTEEWELDVVFQEGREGIQGYKTHTKTLVQQNKTPKSYITVDGWIKRLKSYGVEIKMIEMKN